MARLMAGILQLFLVTLSCWQQAAEGKVGLQGGSETPPIGARQAVAQSDKPKLVRYHDFISRPDLKLIPKVEPTIYPPFDKEELAQKPYYLFFGPHNESPEDGPLKTSGMIVKSTGEPVWISKEEERYFDFHVVEYNGQPHLVYWTGEMQDSLEYGRTTEGHGVLLDQSYQKAPVDVQGVFRRRCHMHEMNVLPEGTALLLMQDVKEQVHDGRRVKITDDYIQEVNLTTREVLFDFSVADNIDVRESYQPLPWNNPTNYHVDAYHANSASKSNDKVVASCRHSHQIVCADHKTRKWLWTLGGKNSSFTLDPPESHFRWQHDGRLMTIDGEEYVTMFDNRNAPGQDHGQPSRGLMFHLDYENMVAKMVREYTHEKLGTSASQGSMRILDDGDVLLATGGGDGGGHRAVLFTEDGQVKFSWDWLGQSYRGLAGEWNGMPNTKPDMVVQRSNDSIEAYISWNGATQLSKWALFGIDDPADPSEPRFLAYANHTWFETHISLDQASNYVMAVAMDASQKILASTLWMNEFGEKRPLSGAFEVEDVTYSALYYEGCLDESRMSGIFSIVFDGRLFSAHSAGIAVAAAVLAFLGGLAYLLHMRRRKAKSTDTKYTRVPLGEL